MGRIKRFFKRWMGYFDEATTVKPMQLKPQEGDIDALQVVGEPTIDRVETADGKTRLIDTTIGEGTPILELSPEEPLFTHHAENVCVIASTGGQGQGILEQAVQDSGKKTTLLKEAVKHIEIPSSPGVIRMLPDDGFSQEEIEACSKNQHFVIGEAEDDEAARQFIQTALVGDHERATQMHQELRENNFGVVKEGHFTAFEALTKVQRDMELRNKEDE